LFDEPKFDQLLASTPTFRSWISFVGSSEAVATMDAKLTDWSGEA
jgi:hypothetical protein